MIFAAVDTGNTFSKYAFFEHDTLSYARKSLKSVTLIRELKKAAPSHIIVCSVTKNKTELIQAFKDFDQAIILSQDTSLPIINGYKTPETLGYDRIAAAAGAWFRFPGQNSLIIDMGTAIKYDYINNNGVFEGGIIGPGLKMRFKALHTFTKKLPLIHADGIPELIGTSTETCIQSGVINGMAAEINGIIKRYSQKGNLNILTCGGDAPFFESQINYPTFAAENLVLEGLYRILKHNVEN
jgi:type III pantothenate kinase